MSLFFVIFFISFSFVVLAVGLVFSKPTETSHEQRKPVLGSRPPQCINKCLNCEPCIATLVISPHRIKSTVLPKEEKDESYYLLSWKCRCGDKLFQPWYLYSTIIENYKLTLFLRKDVCRDSKESEVAFDPFRNNCWFF